MIKEFIKAVKEFVAASLIRHTTYVFSGALINGLSLLALNVILARAMSKELFGAFSASLLVLTMAAELSDFGLNAGMLRFGAYYLHNDQLDKFRQILKVVWHWRVQWSIWLTAACLVLAKPIAVYIFNQPTLAGKFALASLGIGGVILLSFLVTHLQIKKNFLSYAKIQSAKGFLRLLLIGVLFLFGIKSFYLYLAVYIAVPWFLLIFNFSSLPKDFTKAELELEERKKLNKQLARFSFWLAIASVVSIIAAKVDQVMISRFLGLADLAIYVAAWQLIQFFPVIYNSINSVIMPHISSLSGVEDLKRFMKKSFFFLGGLTVFLAIFIYPAQYLVFLFFGSRYAAAMPVFLILAFSSAIFILIIPFSLIISYFNKTHFLAISSIIQLVINVGLNWLWLPRYGVIGSAYVFALGILVSLGYNIVCAFYVLKYKKFTIV